MANQVRRAAAEYQKIRITAHRYQWSNRVLAQLGLDGRTHFPAIPQKLSNIRIFWLHGGMRPDIPHHERSQERIRFLCTVPAPRTKRKLQQQRAQRKYTAGPCLFHSVLVCLLRSSAVAAFRVAHGSRHMRPSSSSSDGPPFRHLNDARATVRLQRIFGDSPFLRGFTLSSNPALRASRTLCEQRRKFRGGGGRGFSFTFRAAAVFRRIPAPDSGHRANRSLAGRSSSLGLSSSETAGSTWHGAAASRGVIHARQPR